MEEDKAKKLIQKSVIETSEDFTDKLLLRLESEKVVRPVAEVQYLRTYRWALFAIAVIGTICFVTLLYDFFPKLELLNSAVKLDKTPLFALTTMVLLLGANHILKIRHLASNQSNGYY